MRKFKIIFAGGLFALFVSMLCISCFNPQMAFAESVYTVDKSFECESVERGVWAKLHLKSSYEVESDVTATMSVETNEETLKKFEKYCKKRIDSGDIGELIYVDVSYVDPNITKEVYGVYSYTVKLPKFYKNKDIAIIPFIDYRTTQNLIQATVNEEDGTISFIGNSSVCAYAIVYNGVYKDIILIGVILLILLVVCVTVKVICLRRDNPEIKEKKRQKAISKKKAQHKQNKKLAQELKREKEKLKNKKE